MRLEWSSTARRGTAREGFDRDQPALVRARLGVVREEWHISIHGKAQGKLCVGFTEQSTYDGNGCHLREGKDFACVMTNVQGRAE